MFRTFWYGRKQPSPDKLGSIVLISVVAIPIVPIPVVTTVLIVAVPIVTTMPIADDAAVFIVVIHSTAVFVVACVSTAIISVCVIRSGADGGAPSIHVVFSVSVGEEAIGVISSILYFSYATGSVQILIVASCFSWYGRNCLWILKPVATREIWYEIVCTVK